MEMTNEQKTIELAMKVKVVSDDLYRQWVALNGSKLTYARFMLTATPALISEAVWKATC
jgi:hypothetical protein